MASVMPSERMLRQRTVAVMIMPGKKAVHHLPSMTDRFEEASDRTLPQVGTIVAGSPEPMKVRDASRMIASATRTVAKTRTGAAVLRMTCLTRIQGAFAPETMTART